MRVLLTGSTGFIGKHCLDYLLQHGHAVTTTVRSDVKGKQSLEVYPQFADNLSYIIVPDMTLPGAFNNAVQSSTFEAVIHMASPFNYSAIEFKRDMIDPAVQGTTSILRAVKDFAPSVKRVVITSSFAAVINFQQPVHMYTADDWNPITMEQALSGGQMAYVGSKTFAERAAWDFIETEKPSFTLSTINPVMVFGPVTNQLKSLDNVNTSNSLFRDIITGKMKDAVPPNSFQWVDVRDVALAHVRAIEVSEAGGKRFLASAGKYSNSGIASIIKENFPGLTYKLPEHIDSANEEVGFLIDSSPVREVLGVQFKKLEDSVIDTVNSLLKVQD